MCDLHADFSYLKKLYDIFFASKCKLMLKEKEDKIMGITMVLSLLSGVALFLYGMSLMGDSLKKVAGNKLELILYRLTNTPLKGLLLGTVVTAIIQSSSATTVMVVGYENKGMLK